jgi:ATP adenylyltransferase/5',5'''-P-1,P-4-tetraphosphate phosphorylase II
MYFHGEQSGDSLLNIYTSLCKAADLSTGSAHNMILTRGWMLVIPRVCAIRGLLSANATPMIGIVWVPEVSVYNEWMAQSPMKALLGFGKPIVSAQKE